jgi:LCP family protein required for cell wall assembly
VTTPPASSESPDAADPSPLAGLGGSGGYGEPPRRSRGRRVAKWTAISLVVILVLGAGGVAADGWYLNHKIKKVPVIIPKGSAPRPTIAARAHKAENFLLIGSDSRAGASGKGTGGAKIQGARSDTTIILHISANQAGATLISIPRDSYVSIPSCQIGPKATDTSAPEMSKFNAAFSLGGQDDAKYAASCTIHTIETDTGIRINHYAVVNFAGFQKMVDALGGVRMCVAKNLYDPIVLGSSGYHGSNLHLTAGKNVEIDGQQALDLMRARYALDGGGDLPRIKRQQLFIGAMIRKATSGTLLIDPLKLQRFLSAAAGSLTTDGFGINTMKKLATALHHVGAGGVRLLTVPNTIAPNGPLYGDVLWKQPDADALWTAIINDEPIPGTKATPTASASPSPTPTPSGPPLTVAPSNITINVENGTSESGLAHTMATELAAKGFTIGTVGDAQTQTYAKTIVEYGSEKVQSSETVKAAIPGAKRRADSTAGSVITVIVGANFTKVVAVTLATSSNPTPTPSATASISSISAAKNSCLS